MHRKSFTIALCMMASAAMAQGGASSPSASAPPAPQLIRAALSTGPSAQATARTGDGRPAAAGSAAPQAAAARPADEESSRSAGLPMLLAALALMTGIALRRWGAGPE
jgi:hypothetical protein